MAYDFDRAWREVESDQRDLKPRSVTNKVEEIAREAVAAKRWPDAARAFLVRENAMEEFRDEFPKDWLPAFAASVDAQPATLQAVLQLHLAHTYLNASGNSRWGGAAPTKLDDAAAKDKMPPWSPEKINATLEAQFAKVFAHTEELKAQKLSDWSTLFNPGTMPESYCPTLFDFAVHDAISFYGRTIPDKTLEKGLALYDSLIAFHRQDGNLDALALAELDRAEYIHLFDEKTEKARNAAFIAFLDGFLSRYGDKTDVSALAAEKKVRVLCGIGKTYNEVSIEDSESSGDSEKNYVAGHDLAAAYAAKWTESLGGRLCADLVKEIESKQLSVEVERNWCAPWPEMEVTVRNLTEIHFRLVPVTFDDLVSDRSMGCESHESDSRSALKDKYVKRTPAKEWKETLPLKPGYTRQTFRFQVPAGVKSGHYVLYAAANDKFGEDKLPLFAQYVTVTSLALALETGDGAFGGFVCRAESGVPVAGATVELWGYPEQGGRFQALRETYVTDASGRFTADVSKGRNGVLYRYVRVVKDGEEVLSLKNTDSGYVDEEKKTLDHVDLFTDRALYRPGQEIKVKGIAYHADPRTRDFHTLPNETVVVTLTDPNEKEVASKRIKLNKWGSFTHTFAVPTDRLTGRYTVQARIAFTDDRIGVSSKEVNVEEYKRPKFTAAFGKSSGEAVLGEPVTVSGKALTYSGQPVQKAKVTWNVNRTTQYPGWCRWFGIDAGGEYNGFVAEGEAETDANGVFKVTFTPVASPKDNLEGQPSFWFNLTATVTDATGEAHTAQHSFEIGTVAWCASLWTEGEWHEAGKGFGANVTLTSLAGTKVPVKGTLRVFRLKSPAKPVREPLGRSGYFGNGGDKKKPWDWTSWEVGEEVFSSEADSGTAEKWTTKLKLDVGTYRLVFETKEPGGKTVRGIHHVCVFDPAAKEFGIPVPNFFLIEKSTVKVGETLRAYWGTGYETGYCRVKVTNNGKTLLDSAVSGENPKWLYELPIQDENRGEICLEAAFVRENRIYYDYHVVNVPWDNKYLDITAEHLTSKLNPGGEETWTFKVSGPSEVLAFMYDRSLDAYKWHNVSTDFSRYFTPWTRFFTTPSLQNAVVNFSSICGIFPGSGRPVVVSKPTWRVIEWPVARKERGLDGICDSIVLEEGAAAAAQMGMGDRPADAKMKPEPKDIQPRRNLKETAFFFPNLETDADGKVSFSFTVPDALTGWKLLMVAHDNALNNGVFREDKIVTVQPLMCEPNAPRFVREGDDFLFAVKVTNTEDAPQKGVVELKVDELKSPAGNATPSTLQPFNFSTLQPFNLDSHESKTFEFRVSIPDGCGYLKYLAKATGTVFSDGEEGILPVLSRRILVREAVQLHARGKETRTFRLENLLASKGSETIRHQDLTVRAVSRPAWYAVLSLPYLMEFPHECCEQTFSRYYANALGEYIANADPRIRQTFDAWKAAGGDTLKSPLETDPRLKAIALEATPWVREAEHEGVARARLGALFGKDRLAAEQQACLEKLRQAQNADGLWPWFPGGPSSDAISLFILTGYARLNALTGAAYPDFFERALRSLDERVSEAAKERQRPENPPFRVNGFDLRWLYLHSFKGVPAPEDKTLVPLFFKHLRKEWTDFDLGSQALAAIASKRIGETQFVLNRMGKIRFAKKIMESIKERAVRSDELGMYWKLPYFFSCSVFAAPVSTQAVMIEAFREVTGDEASAEACCVWLLKQKQTQDWTTTAATADAIYALLLDGGTDLLAGDTLAEVTLAGEKVKPGTVEAGTGMYAVRYAAEAVKPDMGEIAFTGAGGKGVSWGGVHWSYFEDVLKVRAHEPKELRVEKKYYKKVKDAEGTRLTAIEGTLEPGDELVARLEITSDRTYEFVHLSDERPACAEPEDVLSSYRWRDGVGYYQSTRDTATHYYIDRLNKGVFVLETSYRVQQKGTFTGGLATIQCMYAPEFTAHSTAETVQIPTQR